MRLEADITARAGAFTLEAKLASDAGVTALFGRSGSGKTTVLNAIAGLVRPQRGRIRVDETVYFDSGSDRIQKRSFELLDQVASVLKQARQVLKLRVEGHTDARGNDGKNLELSKRRAAAVAQYLAGAGVEPERLASEGYGESQPLTPDQTREGRAKNRRVEFRVLDQSSPCAQPAAW